MLLCAPSILSGQSLGHLAPVNPEHHEEIERRLSTYDGTNDKSKPWGGLFGGPDLAMMLCGRERSTHSIQVGDKILCYL